MKLTKKQKLINKKERHKKSKKYIKKQERIELRKKDSEWSKKVRQNPCMICGTWENLNAHHIIPRGNIELRWDIDNSLSLCAKHHRYSFDISAHQNSFVFYKIINKRIVSQIDRLWDKFIKTKSYKKMLLELKEYN